MEAMPDSNYRVAFAKSKATEIRANVDGFCAGRIDENEFRSRNRRVWDSVNAMRGLADLVSDALRGVI